MWQRMPKLVWSSKSSRDCAFSIRNFGWRRNALKRTLLRFALVIGINICGLIRGWHIINRLKLICIKFSWKVLAKTSPPFAKIFKAMNSEIMNLRGAGKHLCSSERTLFLESFEQGLWNPHFSSKSSFWLRLYTVLRATPYQHSREHKKKLHLFPYTIHSN